MSYLKREQEAIDHDVALIREALERKRVRRDIGYRIANELPPSKEDALAALDRIANRIGASNQEREPS